MSLHKSLTERIAQAVAFELLALLICTPLLSWIMDRPMVDMGVVTLGIGLLALAWNVLFTACSIGCSSACGSPMVAGHEWCMRCCSKAGWWRSRCR